MSSSVLALLPSVKTNVLMQSLRHTSSKAKSEGIEEFKRSCEEKTNVLSKEKTNVLSKEKPNVLSKAKPKEKTNVLMQSLRHPSSKEKPNVLSKAKPKEKTNVLMQSLRHTSSKAKPTNEIIRREIDEQNKREIVNSLKNNTTPHEMLRTLSPFMYLLNKNNNNYTTALDNYVRLKRVIS